jgi:hypothetical protein
MTEFLNSLKADLLDRRMLPLVALVCVALAGAVAYASLGGGSSSSTPAPAAVPSGPVLIGGAGISVSQPQTSTSQAVAETTDGTSSQRHGIAHDPFAALPGAVKTTAPTASTATAGSSSSKSTTESSSSSKSGSGSSSGSGSTPSTPATPAKPTTPAKPKPAYNVAILFGVVPAGTTISTAAGLQPYASLKLQTPLPAKAPVVIYRGVTTGGKSAAFTIYGEVILRGNGVCMPNTVQCSLIDLKPGQSEQLEYLDPSGTAIVYELRIVSIAAITASTAGVKNALRGESKAGRELLRRAGLDALPGMHYSTQAGVIALDGHHGFAASTRARAHIAVVGAHHSG